MQAYTIYGLFILYSKKLHPNVIKT